LYVKKENGSIIIVCLYVDDLLFTGNDVKMMQKFKQDMMQAYEMSDLGLLNYFLGIEVSQVKEGIFISQKKYTKSILQKFKMMDCRSVALPLAATHMEFGIYLLGIFTFIVSITICVAFDS